MIDLTPLDVRKKRGDFRPKLRGYDPEEVDGFLELVAERFEELVKENLILSERAERFSGQLKALEGRESAVHEALVSAQKLREEVSDQTQREVASLKEQSRREAVILKAEAETEISRRLGEAEGLIRERQWALEELERSRNKFLKGFRSLLERETEALEVEEARRPLEETPLDLNLRGWTPVGEEEEAEETVLEETEDDEPSGFETQRLEVPVASELAEVSERFEPGAEGVSELPDEPPDEAPDEAPVEPSDEPESTKSPAEASDELESVDFDDEASDELESVEFSDEASEEPTFEPEHPHHAESDQEPLEVQSQDVESGFGMEEGEPSNAPQQPKWLFSLLKREEGEAPEGEAEDGNSEREV